MPRLVDGCFLPDSGNLRFDCRIVPRIVKLIYEFIPESFQMSRQNAGICLFELIQGHLCCDGGYLVIAEFLADSANPEHIAHIGFGYYARKQRKPLFPDRQPSTGLNRSAKRLGYRRLLGR
jgi:hypothetical protein